MIGHPQPANQVRGWSCLLGAAARLFAVSLLALSLSGCLAKRNTYDIPDVPLAPSFKNRLPAAVPEKAADAEKPPTSPTPAEDNSLVEWWRYFGNRELEGLINRGVANNPDMRIATIRLAQAKLRADQADAGLLPSLSSPLTVARQAPGGTVGSVPVGSTSRAPQTSIQSSLRGDLRLDVWGEQSALAESAQMQVWRAAFERDNVQRNVTATIAANYVEYAALNDRLRVARETERALSDTLSTVEKRLAMGDATVGDLEQQKALVFGLRAAIPSMQQQREDAINTLAFLVGTLPGSLNLSEEGLESLGVPEVVPGLPSALLLRRPDVRMVEARLLAADADIDVARARILPPVDLSAQAGYSSNMLAQLFLPKAFFWSTVASLSASIFDGGKRRNEKKYTEAMYEEMVETYIRTIYQAMREVEGALSTIRLAGNRLDAQREAATAARRAWEINSRVYAMGGADQMSLLEAERTFHRYQDEYQRAQMDHYRGYISLFQALGGGVKPAGSLPGKGSRPSPATSGKVSGSLAAASPVKAFSVDGVDIQSSGSGVAGQGEHFWLIELPGLYHRSTVGAAWRDLRERYPAQMEGRILRPRLSGRIEEGGDSQEAWYRLSIAKFASEAEARALCDQLLASQERCQVVYSRPGETPPKAEVKAVAAAPAETVAKEDKNALPGAVDREKEQEKAPAKAQSVVVDPLAEAEKPAPSIGEKALESPVAKPATPAPAGDEEKRPMPADEGKPQPAYTVQLGAFSNPENAAIAAALWQFRGYEVYVNESRGADGRNWYAVRSGLFGERRAGAAVAQQIRRQEEAPAMLVPAVLDQSGKLATLAVEPLLAQRIESETPLLPEPPEVLPPVPPAAKVWSLKAGKAARKKGKATYSVQLGAFSSRDNARMAMDFWKSRQLDAFLSLIVDADGRPWFAVRAGFFKSRRDAAALALQLGRQENAAALVVPASPEAVIAPEPIELDKPAGPASRLAQVLPMPSEEGGPIQTAPVVPAAVAPPIVIRYSVQLAAFASIENAARGFAEWQARGYEPYVCETDVKGRLRFAVRTGGFARKAEAEQMVRTIQRQDGRRGVLVPALLDGQGALRQIDVSPLLANPALDLPPSAELSATDVR